MIDERELLLEIGSKLPIASWRYPRIGLAIPLGKSLEHAGQTFYNFMYIASQGPWFVECPPSVRIDIVRNNVAVQLLRATGLTHVLMLDADHKHPVDIIQQFAKWAIIRPDARVISGLNFRRGEPYDPVAGNLTDSHRREIFTQWEPGLNQVDEVGGASLFVHRSVFEQIQPPWFFNTYDYAMENNYPGEDIGFCKKCREAGIPIYVDTTISSPHCTDTLVTENTFRTFMAMHPEKFE